jgi:hypothetical protein
MATDAREWVEAVGRSIDRLRDSDQWRADREYQAAVDRALNPATGGHEHRRPRTPDGWPANVLTPDQIAWDLTAAVAEGRMDQIEPGVFRADPGEICVFCLEESRRGMGPNSGPG